VSVKALPTSADTVKYAGFDVPQVPAFAASTIWQLERTHRVGELLGSVMVKKSLNVFEYETEEAPALSSFSY